ncbi:type I polyketide synthase, partial [Kitasatospora sp. NPDC059408]|uniref:type I polyketide synthase n=1 Tax=Kitasatospora sp. NPDC059408 TaxID=3346823 RepID=UPI0036903093
MTRDLDLAGSEYAAPQEPIAIIGLSCRLPQAPDPESFWRLLRDGSHAITRTPADRWDADALHDADPTAPGKINTRYGAFLDDVDRFDAGFFGISPREAAAMDPQQRLVLELSWEALEDARIRPADLAGSRTGVFVGAIWDDYATLLHQYGPEAITQHSNTGLNRGIIANRVSYTLDLHGPSLTVDTAQSSALVAVHLACESLRRGETDLAVAGGVNLNLIPESAITAAKFGGLSPDGRCFTFDARANGYVRGEGGATVVLKPLARALADGDPVHAVIRGSAVNSDGGTDGLTVPSPDAQAEVLRQAYGHAGVEPSAVQYVELHGTGTRVGDPVEAAALGAVLGAGRSGDAALRVGSAKTNVGHLEGAAGIVGLLKAVLSISHRELPASLNYESPNPAIPLGELGLRVQDERSAWPSPDAPLLAGVSSFGMGGTNCHVVLAEAPVTPADGPTRTAPDGPVSWVLSGRSPEALRGQAARLLEALRTDRRLGAADPLDIAYSLATTRTAFEHRGVVIGSDLDELTHALEQLADGEPSPNVVRGTATGSGKLAFLLSGQGSQRAGAGRELYETQPVFAEALDRVLALLEPGLRDIMFAEPGTPQAELINDTRHTQPALFALQTALYRLLESQGITPDYLLGHSIGEVTAAHLAGILNLEDATTLVSARARLMADLPREGGMIAVQATEEQILPLLNDRVSIAAINGPESLVVS